MEEKDKETPDEPAGNRGTLASPISERPDELPQPLQAAVEFLHRRGVRDANVLLGSEALARNRGHVRFAQKLSREIRRRVYPAASEERRHIRIDVERALGQVALHPGDGAQPGRRYDRAA